MKIPVDGNLEKYVRKIAENPDLEYWRDHESPSWFQDEKLNGGFDALDDVFGFSFRPKDGVEYWFQFSIEEATRAANGEIIAFQLYQGEVDWMVPPQKSYFTS